MLIGARTAAWGGRQLPYDYAVEYITSENASYVSYSDYRFETSLKSIGPNTRFVVRMMFLKYESPSAQIGTDFPGISFCGVDHRNDEQAGMFAYDSPYLIGVKDTNRIIKYDFDFKKLLYAATVEGLNPISATAPSIELTTSPVGYCLFGRYLSSTTIRSRAYARTYSFEAWENDVKTHDYIPCVNGGRLAFYNKVDGSFIYAQGQDVFEAGPRI